MEEIWKDVVGYEDYYEVSNLGQVRNKKTKYILSQYVANNGYMSLRLGKCNKDKKTLMLVHRLVAEAFVPNPNHLLYVGNIDEIRTHNYANNLKWCTASENNNEIQHKTRISNGRKNVCMKGKAQKINVYCDGCFYDSITEFSTEHFLNPSTVWRWLNNVTKMPTIWEERGLCYA